MVVVSTTPYSMWYFMCQLCRNIIVNTSFRKLHLLPVASLSVCTTTLTGSYLIMYVHTRLSTGQFWNIPVSISPMTTTTPASLTLDSLPPPYILTLSPPLSRPRQFIARLYSNTWDKRGRECFYAGSAQGGPLGELESPQLRDSVIEGRYTDYRVNTLFDTEFTYTQFNSRECTNQR